MLKAGPQVSTSVKKTEESAYSLGPFLSMIGENGVASSLGVSRGKFGDGVGLDITNITNNDGSRSERGKKKVERTRGLTSWIGGSSGRRGRS